MVTDESAAVVEQVIENKEIMFIARIDDSSLTKNVWLIDSGCSNHITGNERLFTELDRSFNAQVKIGNGVYLKVLGISIIAMETPSSLKQISKVHFVPEADQNLLSVGKLAKNHYALLFKDKYYIIFDPMGEELLTVDMKNNCYPLDLMDTKNVSLYSELDTSKL